MKLSVEIESIRVEVKNKTLMIWSGKPLCVLSSAVFNGGPTQAYGIINVQVPEGSGKDKNDVHWNAEQFLEEQVQKLGLPNERVVGLMTAAKMKNLAVATRKFDGTTLSVFVTAGTTIAATAGEATVSRKCFSEQQKFGTINVILLVDGNLTGSSLVEAHKTVTEAKTVALRELDVRSQFSGDLASGTLTDSVVVACTGKGEAIKFAGTFTVIGELIGECVRECVKNAIYNQEVLAASRPLADRLAERGIKIKDLVSLVGLSATRGSKYERFRAEVEKTFADRKIASLVLACVRFDEDLKVGLIPGDTNDAVDREVFEEILQDAIRTYLSSSECLSGSEVRENVRAKVKNMGPLTSCVFEAILKRVSSKVGN
jgi:adenosylcobinamide hydrolase